jgi:hypothetical protein
MAAMAEVAEVAATVAAAAAVSGVAAGLEAAAAVSGDAWRGGSGLAAAAANAWRCMAWRLAWRPRRRCVAMRGVAAGLAAVARLAEARIATAGGGSRVSSRYVPAYGHYCD